MEALSEMHVEPHHLYPCPRMSLDINAAIPWFIITFSFITTLALHGSYFSHASKMLGCLKCKYENCIFILQHLQGTSPINLITVSWWLVVGQPTFRGILYTFKHRDNVHLYPQVLGQRRVITRPRCLSVCL